MNSSHISGETARSNTQCGGERTEEVSEITDQFELMDLVGSGFEGTVYRARHLHLQRLTALKLSRSVRPSAARRLLREGAVLARINHPNVVRIYDSGLLSNGRSFLACEWIDGMPLRKLTDTVGVGRRTAAVITHALAGALEGVHAAGYIHGDLNPQNVMIPEVEGTLDFRAVKLLDLGMSDELTTSSDIPSPHTATGRVSGTPLYMAPEQSRGARQTCATDVYGLGGLFFHLFYGRPPMDSTEEAVTYQVSVGGRSRAMRFVRERLTRSPTLPEDVTTPSAVRELLNRTLAFDPGDRYQTAGELRDAIESVLSSCHLHDAS